MSLTAQLSMSRRLRATPFTSRLQGQGVKSFTVYNHMLLPAVFTDLESDYWHLCEAVQVWDVGAERQVSIHGPDASKLVQWMTPRDIAAVGTDRCVYLPLADQHGRLVNDPIGIRLAENHWGLSIGDSDVLLWARGLALGAGLDVEISEPDVWPLAVQGPLAETLMQRVFGDAVTDIGFFRYTRLAFQGHDFIVARSGWSKQGGFEIYIDDVDGGQALYDDLFARGADLNVRACSPNLIDRVESALLSYGGDMDLRHSPLEAGLQRFINLDADIDSLSLPALRREQAAGAQRRIRGLYLPAPAGPVPVAADPFANAAGQYTTDPAAVCSIHLNDSLASGLGAQVYSPRYRQQLLIAMLEEPLASQAQCSVMLADGSTASAGICDLPFDFKALGLQAHQQE